MNNEERQSHIDELAKQMNCLLIQEKDIYPQMFAEKDPPKVTGPIIEGQFDYLVMLHELGHIAYGHTQDEVHRFYFDNGVLKSEAQAWEYAILQMREQLEAESKERIRDYLMTYLNESVRANGQLWHIYRPGLNGNIWKSPPFRFDPPDYALRVIARLESEDYNV